MTTRIKILPEAVINKIAAGEVIDRPASVVKELMENSLDAGAKAIRVRVQGSRGGLISVADDGCGLSADDALLSLERHATSKITSLADVESINTLGFRGEALPSIAAVSRFTIETRRPEDDSGHRLEAIGGSVKSITPIARPYGTTVVVRQLFFNTPVRRKFLRSAATETSHVIKVFLRLSLANPAHRMELEHDGRALYVLPDGGTLEQRLRRAFGPRFPSGMCRVDIESSGMSINGYIANPDASLSSTYQHFFVNNRPVEDRLLQGAVRESLRSLAAGRNKTSFVLYLTLDPKEVDINVHPTKKEVRFSQPTRVYRFITDAIVSAVRSSSGPKVAKPAFFRAAGRPPVSLGNEFRNTVKEIPTLSAMEPTPLPYMPDPHSEARPSNNRTGLEYLGQVMGGYCIAKGPDQLILIDQHAAHERILYENILKRFRENRRLSQELLWPEELNLPAQDGHRLVDVLASLEKVGCVIEPFGRDTFKITALPPEITSEDVKNFILSLMEIFDQTDENYFLKPTWWERPAALIACHGAVKIGQVLKPEDVSRLIDDLAACDDPHHCPHGRPTMVVLDRQGIEKIFDRR